MKDNNKSPVPILKQNQDNKLPVDETLADVYKQSANPVEAICGFFEPDTTPETKALGYPVMAQNGLFPPAYMARQTYCKSDPDQGFTLENCDPGEVFVVTPYARGCTEGVPLRRILQLP